MKAEPSGAGVHLHGTPAPFFCAERRRRFFGKEKFHHSFTHYFILNSHFGPIIPNIDKGEQPPWGACSPNQKNEEDGTYVVWEQGKEN